MTLSLDKHLHFVTGIAIGIGFWWLLERYARVAARAINPLVFRLFANLAIGIGNPLLIARSMQPARSGHTSVG